MTRRGEAALARGRGLIGTRFRAQGRSREGLDCVGLAVAAFGKAGARGDYALRSDDMEALATELLKHGFRPVERREPGDLLVMRSGVGQLHLGLWTGEALIHADAGLRRVVERPGEVLWPILSIWREED